jgi:peptidyl-prolyl cis-trans isomerase D
MSIIQNIRDKYARVAVIAVAVALIGFILTDYLVGKGRGAFSSGRSNMIGSVNGKKIALDAFGKKVDQMEENYKQQGYPIDATTTQNIVEQVWNQEISRVLFQSEFIRPQCTRCYKKSRY